FPQRARVECPGGLRAGAGRRIGFDRARHEAERANDVEAVVETARQLFAAKRQLVEPGRIVDRDGETSVGEASGLGAAGRVGAHHVRPGPTDTLLEKAISQVGDRGEQEISDGARRSTVHAFVSYILSVAGRESG